MRILLVNDDGIYAKGIRILAKFLRELGDVVVVAPDRQKSAAGHSLTINDVLLIKEVEIEEGFKGIAVVDGTPTDCVLVGVKDIMKDEPPDFVVSGINHGANLGGDILYSGTVAGALEGLANGFKSVAISLDVHSDEGHFETAATVAKKILQTPELFEGIVEERSILNVNVPNVPYEELNGFRITRQGKTQYENYLEKYVNPQGKIFYWIGGDRPPHELEEDTDSFAVANKYVSITPINIDLTNYALIGKLKKILPKLTV
jgi:5'-nucleotidase